MSKKLIRASSLALPTTLPHPDAIRSFKDNQHSYDPEFWDFQYSIRRYLGRVSDRELDKRYQEIVRNMNALVSPERHVIPIQSFLSSWYWFRKEHQTRLEFQIRNRELSLRPRDDLLNLFRPKSPHGPKHPNSSDALFRYSKRTYQDDFIDSGRIKISTAQMYIAMENDDARQDDELNKHEFWPGEYTKITTKDGRAMPIIGDLRHTVSLPSYYVFCVSCAWDPELVSEFGGSCVVITDTEEFAARVERAAHDELGKSWDLHWLPVEYFDPYEKHPKQAFDAAMSKDFRFAYQREYRFIWLSQKRELASGNRFLNAGSMKDIVRIHD